MRTTEKAEAPPGRVGALADRAARLGRFSAQTLLAQAEVLYAAYREALEVPEAFACGRSLSRGESRDLVERSIRAELAVALRLSERAASKALEHAQLLIEDLPCTRSALARGLLVWEASEAICATAATLRAPSRAALDERAAEAAPAMTPTQLRKKLDRWREELHEEPFAERHARAREDRNVWLGHEVDGMRLLSALLPAPVASGIYNRYTRIAHAHRDRTESTTHNGDHADPPPYGDHAAHGDHPQHGDHAGDHENRGDRAGSGSGADPDEAVRDRRTLAQLRADSFADVLLDGDIAGTTPAHDGPAVDATYIPGIRADVRLTVAATTAAGLDDAPADLDGYGPIPAALPRELIGTAASFTRVLTDPDTGAITSVGRTHRLPPPRMRLHLQLRDQTCRFPGCTRPASTAEADHTIEWRNGGTTSLDNLCSLCTAHHHVRHGDRWTYTLRPDGTADWTTPTGRLVTTRPPGLPGSAEWPPDPSPDPPRGPRFDDTPPPF